MRPGSIGVAATKVAIWVALRERPLTRAEPRKRVKEQEPKLLPRFAYCLRILKKHGAVVISADGLLRRSDTDYDGPKR